MVNYKQILTLAVFGMVNLSVLGTAVSEEKNAVNGGVGIGGLKPDDEAIERSEVMSDDNQPDSEIKDFEEAVDTLAELKREKAELDKLKSKFQSAEKLAEVKREKEKEGKKEDDKKNDSEMVLTNYEKVENKEKPVDGQNILKSPEKEKDVDDTITLKNKEKKAHKIGNVVKNGEEIVRPFEIAENLYKLGEYKLALEIYRLIDKNKIEDERKIWVLYQTANCYRKQELYDDAVKVYRELRDGYEGTYWSKQAQWYIQDIEWRGKVEGKIVKVIGK
ncbi:MAG: tol-pal system YbgF family protein [Candidatus Scalindua sp.]